MPFNADREAAGVKQITSEGRASWHSLRKCFVNALIRSGADPKTCMTLARHSSAQLTFDVYASDAHTLLQAAVESAAKHVEEAVAASACCVSVAQAVGGDNEEAPSPGDLGPYEVKEVVGDTGLEPVTSRV